VRISGNSEIADISRASIEEQWLKAISFNKLIKRLGATIVKDKEEADYSLDLADLNKNSFTEILKGKEEDNV